MRRNHGVCLLLACLPLLMGGPLAAQTGNLMGTVVDAETGSPLSDVAVEVLGLDQSQAGGIFTNASGQYRFALPPGSYRVVFSHTRYETQRLDGVGITAGETQRLDVRMVSYVYRMNPLVVTASRREEKALESPTHVETVGSEAVMERIGVTPVEHVKALPGVDVAQTGISQSNVVTRGFNNVFSGALLIMTDNRYTHVPSLRFNANNMIAASDLDVDRIEVSLGPGAALYGPNAASGVMHIITASPIDKVGGSAFVSSGVRDGNDVDADMGGIFQSGFRYSHLINRRTGIKVSGQYFLADDWKYIDPLEQLNMSPSNPLVGQRDFTSERYGGELRLDHRPNEMSELIFSAGYNLLARSIELTGLGAGQAEDWAYSYAQMRYRRDRLFAQAFLNQSDAGDTYLLQTGQPVVDKSRMMAAQFQNAFDVGERQSFIYGLDLQRTEPRTDGTITGSNEDDDIIDEVGGYLHSETALTDKLDLVAALRIDHHNRLEDLVFSPRAALSFMPSNDQNFRLTFNRAFSTPTTNNLFLDLIAARNVGGLGYDIRTFGVPEDGLTFDNQCGGTYCMYSPFAPGAELSVGSPGPIWNVLLQGAAAQNPSLATILPYIQDASPAIGTYYRRFNQEEAAEGRNPFLVDAGPSDIARMKPTITNTLELGYKGMVSERILLSADVYYSSVKDFVGPLRTETPSVFMDPTTMGAFLTQKLTPLVQMGAMSAAQLQGTVTSLVTQLAQVPIGTIAPDQRPGTDLLLTYRNFGDVDYYGADLAAQLILTDKLSFRASGSWVSEKCFDFNDDGSCSSAVDISLNAPALKGSFTTRWSDAAMGLTMEGRVRYSDAFDMNSGVFVGEVDAYTLFDANLAYRLPWVPGATFSVTGTNLFDKLHRQFVGAPKLGRMVMARLQYEF